MSDVRSELRQTGLRAIIAKAAAFDARDWQDAAMVTLFGAIGWPWLLKSLGAGHIEARDRLATITGLDPAIFASLGSWRADADLLLMLADHVAATKPKLVVEFGGGLSTLVIARMMANGQGGRLLSFDGDPGFAAHTRTELARHGLEAEVRAVPLVRPRDGGPGRWYDHGPLPGAIDLLVVDGPPWFLHPLVRGNAHALFGAIAPGGSVILDDGARPGERLVAARWSREWPEFDWRFVDNTAGTLMGTRR